MKMIWFMEKRALNSVINVYIVAAEANIFPVFQHWTALRCDKLSL